MGVRGVLCFSAWSRVVQVRGGGDKETKRSPSHHDCAAAERGKGRTFQKEKQRETPPLEG